MCSWTHWQLWSLYLWNSWLHNVLAYFYKKNQNSVALTFNVQIILMCTCMKFILMCYGPGGLEYRINSVFWYLVMLDHTSMVSSPEWKSWPYVMACFFDISVASCVVCHKGLLIRDHWTNEAKTSPACSHE